MNQASVSPNLAVEQGSGEGVLEQHLTSEVQAWAKSHATKVLGLQDDRDLLLCVPARYIDCTRPGEIPERIERGQQATLELWPTGHVEGYSADNRKCYMRSNGHEEGSTKGMIRMDAVMRDASHKTVNVSFFGASRYDSKFDWAFNDGVLPAANNKLVLHGEFAYFGKKLVFRSPKFVPPQWVGKIWPQYRGIPGKLAGARIEAAVNGLGMSKTAWSDALAECSYQVGMALRTDPENVLALAGEQRHSEARLHHMIHALHRPKTQEQAERAVRAAQKIAVMSLREAAMEANTREVNDAAALPITEEHLQRAMQCIRGRTLTAEQRDAIIKTVELFRRGQPANILLNADVGTGKTLVFLTASAAAHLAGAKVAVIAPTEPLADQIYQEYQTTFAEPLGLSAERIMAGKKVKDKASALIGTTGLISVCRKQRIVPNVLVCDEQHKLAVEQRNALQSDITHSIEVTATPIPRSLASVALGGMTILGMKESPVRKNITSKLAFSTDRKEVNRTVAECVARNDRVAFIYPLVKPTEVKDEDTGAQEIVDKKISSEEERAHVEKAFEGLSKTFPGRVAMMHGQMSDAQKKEALDAFRCGEKNIMVASTILETGIDVPDIRLVVVRDADYFGAAQLHQLRGRLARKGGDGKFVMMVAAENDEGLSPQSLARLRAVESSNDGALIAEADMNNRGMGQVDGTDQSGKTPMVFKLLRLTPSQIVSIWKGIEDTAVSSDEIADRSAPPVATSGAHTSSLLDMLK